MLFRLFWIEIDGTGLGWFVFMYQGHLFSQKDTYVRSLLMGTSTIESTESLVFNSKSDRMNWGEMPVLSGI